MHLLRPLRLTTTGARLGMIGRSFTRPLQSSLAVRPSASLFFVATAATCCTVAVVVTGRSPAFCDGKASKTAAATTATATAGDQQQEATSTDQSKGNKNVTKLIVLESELQGEAYWTEKKAQCSFCKAFLESPCCHVFQLWSTCVDRAKEQDVDYTEACSEYTTALFQCTGAHRAYFDQLNANAHADDNDDDDDSSNDDSESNDDSSSGGDSNDDRVSSNVQSEEIRSNNSSRADSIQQRSEKQQQP